MGRSLFSFFSPYVERMRIPTPLVTHLWPKTFSLLLFAALSLVNNSTLPFSTLPPCRHQFIRHAKTPFSPPMLASIAVGSLDQGSIPSPCTSSSPPDASPDRLVQKHHHDAKTHITWRNSKGRTILHLFPRRIATLESLAGCLVCPGGLTWGFGDPATALVAAQRHFVESSSDNGPEPRR